jgi:hypothetical protein
MMMSTTKWLLIALALIVVAWAVLSIWREVSLQRMYSLIMAHNIATASGQTSQLPKDVSKYFEQSEKGQLSFTLFKMDAGMRFAQIPAWIFHGVFVIATLALLLWVIWKS